MTRKGYLKTALIGSFGAFFLAGLSRCENPAAPQIPINADKKTFTSTSNSGHTHSATLDKSEIENPHGAGIMRQITTSGIHSHNFTMGQAELQNVNNGGSSEIPVSITNAYAHEYTMTKWY